MAIIVQVFLKKTILPKNDSNINLITYTIELGLT